MGKLIGAWTRDGARGILIYIVAAVIVIPLGCCLIFVPLSLVSGGSFGEGATMLILIVPMGLFFLLIFGGGGFFIYRVMSRRTHWLDEAMASLGLEGSSYGISGRQYHGVVQGREVDIILYRGPTLNIYVSTPLRTKMSVAERSGLGVGLARAFNREPLVTNNPELEDMVIFAHEERWGQDLIRQPETTAVLRRLIFGESKFLMHQVHLTPESFLFRLYRSKGMFDFQFGAAQVQAWFNDLVRLAEIAESIPAPQEAVEASRLEQGARSGEAAKWGLWIGVGIVAFLCLSSFGILALGFLLALASG